MPCQWQCLWASSAFQHWSYGLRTAICLPLLKTAVFTYTLFPNSQSIFGINAGPCHVFFTTITPNFCYFLFCFNQRSELPFFPPVEFDILLSYCNKLCQREGHSKHMHLWAEMMEWPKYQLWLCRQHRKWMFKGLANWNTAVYKMIQLRVNLIFNELVRKQ